MTGPNENEEKPKGSRGKSHKEMQKEKKALHFTSVICTHLRTCIYTRLSTPLRPLALPHIAKRTHLCTLLEPLLNNMSMPRESALREECSISTKMYQTHVASKGIALHVPQ